MNRILSLVKPRVLSIVLIVLGLLAVILAVFGLSHHLASFADGSGYA